MVFYHGGGFVIGDLDSHDTLARAIVAGVAATGASGAPTALGAFELVGRLLG